MATEKSFRDQLREKFRRSPRLLEMTHGEFTEETEIECNSAEFYKMRSEVKEEKKAEKKHQKGKAKRRAQMEAHDQRVAESKARKGPSKSKRLQVAIAALKPLMEKEGLEEVLIVRDMESGELRAEVREAPPAPLIVVVK